MPLFSFLRRRPPPPPQKLAFVLGGGGARGSLQVGALRALLEAGIRPHLMVGTSIGAVNVTYLAINGLTSEGLDALERAWDAASKANLLPNNYLWLTTRILFNRAGVHPYHHRFRDFFISQGISPQLTFSDIAAPAFYQIATDLNHQTLRIYGTDPEDKVLDT